MTKFDEEAKAREITRILHDSSIKGLGSRSEASEIIRNALREAHEAGLKRAAEIADHWRAQFDAWSRIEGGSVELNVIRASVAGNVADNIRSEIHWLKGPK